MAELRIGNITIHVVKKDIKNVHLAVYPPNGRIRLAAPNSMSEETIRLFALSKYQWIKQNQRDIQKQPRETKREFKNRESHYFFGNRYLLRLKETKGAGYVALSGKSHLDLYVKNDASIDYMKNTLDEWYRTKLKEFINELREKWETIIGLSPTFVGVRSMKTKWGSCITEKKRIWLNLELAKKPKRCIEYIFVHEMVHLLERHHNDRFQQLMDHYLPNWRRLRKELNELPVNHVDWEY